MAYNPLLTEEQDDQKEVSFLSLNTPRWWRNCLEPTTEWNFNQRFWIWKSTILTCCVSFGVSYFIGYTMLSSKPKPTLDDMLLNFMATSLLTPLMNWLIGGTLMSGEVLMGQVAVIDPRELRWWPDEAEDHIKPFTGIRWWFTPSDLILQPSYHKNPSTCLGYICSYLKRLIFHLFRSIPWIILAMVLMVPSMYVFSYFVFGQNNYNSYPQPQIMLSVQTLLISLIYTPIWARIVLANLGSKLVHDQSYVDFMVDLDAVDIRNC